MSKESIPSWVYDLAKKWETDRTTYPADDPRAEGARVAVKLCQQELLQAAANALSKNQ